MVGPVDPKETDAMKRLMQIMSGGTPQHATSDGVPIVESARHGEPDVDAMKDILQRFYSATTNAATTLHEDAQSSPEVRNALVTERTPRGAKVGSWEIRVNQVNEKLKTFDVSNVLTGDSIAMELRLYEAAHALVKLLNAGHGINTTVVREVLSVEESFCKHYLDAVSFRHTVRNCQRLNESRRAHVAEDRYAEARRKALLAREQLRRLNERL